MARSNAPIVQPQESAGSKSGAQRIVQTYVSIVSALDIVDTVLVEEAPDGLRVWTVIDAEPSDRAARQTIYTSELRAHDAAPGTLVDFRLVNQREYDGETLKNMLPDSSHVAWQRPSHD